MLINTIFQTDTLPILNYFDLIAWFDVSL